MDAEKKAQWVAALRSGEYKQTAGVLYRTVGGMDPFDYPVGYCCLGVLTDLAVKDGVGEWSRTADCATHVHSLGHNDYVLPTSVAEWCDFGWPGDKSCQEGRIELPDADRTGETALFLTGLNDDDPYMDFEKIADMVDYFM